MTSGSSSSRNSDIFYLEPPPPYSEVIKKYELQQPTMSAQPEQSFSSSSLKSAPTSSRSVQNELVFKHFNI